MSNLTAQPFFICNLLRGALPAKKANIAKHATSFSKLNVRYHSPKSNLVSRRESVNVRIAVSLVLPRFA
jgi:hypothetical protein